MRDRREFVQMCWLVNDLDEAVGRWQKATGIGPFLVGRHPTHMVDVRYRGEPAELDVSVALAQAGPVQIELLEQHTEGAVGFRDGFAPGAEGIHHACCFVPDLAAELERTAALGIGVVMDGGFVNGIRFAFIDTREELGFLTELFEGDKLVGPRSGIFERVANAARDWDGAEPVQSL